MPIILALRRLRQEDCEFEVILGYMVRPCLKKTNKFSNVTIKYFKNWAGRVAEAVRVPTLQA
jgi:hypothetical protein